MRGKRKTVILDELGFSNDEICFILKDYETREIVADISVDIDDFAEILADAFLHGIKERGGGNE